MNSLSILSSRVDKVIGSTPSTPTSDAFKELRPQQVTGPETLTSQETSTCPSSAVLVSASVSELHGSEDEVTPSVEGLGSEPDKMPSKLSALKDVYSRTAQAWVNAYRWAVNTITFCAGWIAKWFYDENDKFFVYLPAYTILITLSTILSPQLDRISSSSPGSAQGKLLFSTTVKNFMRVSSSEGGSAVSSATAFPTHSHHARARSVSHGDSAGEETAPRRSIRIRLFSESSSKSSKSSSVKSPTSPSNSSTLRLTKYPRSTGPPRPLLAKNPPQKTLILDLDETLIHSLSKGGRLTSGHMVEVKLEGQHPILYYVHKRPYCEEFLRKVYKWYNLVIFTASVQEYADPVIDWLEQDRKYFKGRYYRQHCTHRNGTYIKDITSIEPDLSKVIILDNSPISYLFHEDNAIPIEGWINDPTDIDLLNLIPLLHALHYVTDVRALLSLRMGEAFS